MDEDTKDVSDLVRNDVQLACMLKTGGGDTFDRYRLDFPHQYVDFCDLDFSGLRLFRENLGDVCLKGVNFSDAILHGVSFRGADLRGAKFDGADVKGCDFENADVTGARFTGCWVEEACWYRTRGVSFRLRLAILWRLFWGWCRPYPAGTD